MEEAYIIFNILIVGVGIIMIILFIQNYINIKAIKKMLGTTLDSKSKLFLSRNDILKAILLGKQKETHEQIVQNLTNLLYNRLIHNNPNHTVTTEKIKNINSQIKYASQFCDMLGIELPQQLSTIDNFIDFFNTNNPNPIKLNHVTN